MRNHCPTLSEIITNTTCVRVWTDFNILTDEFCSAPLTQRSPTLWQMGCRGCVQCGRSADSTKTPTWERQWVQNHNTKTCYRILSRCRTPIQELVTNYTMKQTRPLSFKLVTPFPGSLVIFQHACSCCAILLLAWWVCIIVCPLIPEFILQITADWSPLSGSCSRFYT